MYRQSPSRNQRSKGIKVKNVLQICVLLAVCFWLIYQVKHSHDKKKEFEETDAKASLRRGSGDELIKLGRKDIRPPVDETDSKDDIHDEQADEDETMGEEVEENKHSEDDSDDKKVEEKEEEEAGGQDVETEHEQEKSDSDIDTEQGLVDSEENETQETDSGEGNGRIEKESTVDDADDRSSHEAREEHYKADDASSAVSHDSGLVSENENEHVENSIEQNNSEGRGSNVTASATEEDTSHDPENSSTSNNDVTEGSNDRFTSNSTDELSVENNDLPSDNLTESKPEIVHDQGNVPEGTSVEESGFQNVTRLDSNSTVSAETTDGAGDSRLDAEEGNTSPEKNNEFEGGKSESSEGTDEILETISIDNPEEVQEDAIDITDTSISTSEKEIRTDLDMLPEIQSEGTDNGDVAAE